MQKEEFCPIPDTLALQWLALSLVPGLGFRSIQEMLNAGKSISELLQATPGELVRDLGINSKVANKIASASKASTFAIEKRLIEESPETQLYCPESEAYPLQLKEIASPPSVLYWKGIESGRKTLSCFRWFPCLQRLWAEAYQTPHP